MAFTANTAFEARITNNENDILSHIAGLYQASGANADCDAGRLVTADSLANCEGFTGIKNENTWIMVDATDAATIDTPVYACDTYDNKLIYRCPFKDSPTIFYRASVNNQCLHPDIFKGFLI